MSQRGFYVFNYIDDLIGCDPPEIAEQAYVFLQRLLSELGLDISEEKLYCPQNQVPCLGILVNVTNGMISIPQAKLEQVKQICTSWATSTKANKSELKSLTSLLLYIHNCVKPARLFVNRILITLCEAPDKGYVTIDQGFAKDITWFNQFLSQFNGSVFFYKELQPPITTMYVDACLIGMGGCWNNQVYTLPNTHLFGIHDKTIVHLEMVNILVALCLWGKQLQHFKLILNCDNEAVVHMLQLGCV